MIAIICKRDGDPRRAVPIMSDEDDGRLAVFKNLDEAKLFAQDNLLCQVSAVIFIDLLNDEIEY